MGDNYGEDWVVPRASTRRLLKEAGYDGTPVVILQPSDIAMVSRSRWWWARRCARPASRW